MPHEQDPTSWQPATSEPGELYTVEGRIRAVGAFAKGLKHQDPRGRRYRKGMQRTGLLIVLIGIGVVALVLVISGFA